MVLGGLLTPPQHEKVQLFDSCSASRLTASAAEGFEQDADEVSYPGSQAAHKEHLQPAVDGAPLCDEHFGRAQAEQREGRKENGDNELRGQAPCFFMASAI